MFRLTSIVILVISIVYVNGATKASKVAKASKPMKEWWRDSFIYQIYPRSFMDSNGDGIGDLNGITSKLEYFVDLNVSAIWLSPIFESPMVDFGYDVSNYTNIDPIFGNLSDFVNLTTQAKAKGLKVILDFVPNHSSDQHPWFLRSVQKIKPYDDYYVWMDGKLMNGTRKPPNNWLSVFGGSAWEYNAERGQYYLHQFSVHQPDLNYRNPLVAHEMQKILTFWMNRGVDGFRIDAINYIFEDPEFRNEPKRPNKPEGEYGSLVHIRTKDLDETFDILQSWRKVLDTPPKKGKLTGPKVILTEAYTKMYQMMAYFEAGSDIPMNFIFIDALNLNAKTLDYKADIDTWMHMVPKGKVANWVVGNHDNPRVGTRFGEKRADEISMLAAVLPGVGIIYYGDEIGMVDRNMTFEETVDSQACNLGPEKYYLTSRDPARTPFQWDNTTNAGFSTANKTWLPVHENYKTLNLAAQKADPTSHYSLFKKLVALKKMPAMVSGTMEVILVGENVLGVVRKLPDVQLVVLLINFTDETIVVDAKTWMDIPEQLTVYASSVDSNIPSEVIMDTTEINLPGSASVILYGS